MILSFGAFLSFSLFTNTMFLPSRCSTTNFILYLSQSLNSLITFIHLLVNPILFLTLYVPFSPPSFRAVNIFLCFTNLCFFLLFSSSSSPFFSHPSLPFFLTHFNLPLSLPSVSPETWHKFSNSKELYRLSEGWRSFRVSEI